MLRPIVFIGAGLGGLIVKCVSAILGRKILRKLFPLIILINSLVIWVFRQFSVPTVTCVTDFVLPKLEGMS